jgi:putative resolvase
MKKHFSIKEAAAQCGVCTKTLQKWERKGKLKPMRTPGKHRRYTQEMIDALLRSPG